MAPKKILIAGGAGFIGSTLSPYLQQSGHDVTVVDACWFGNYLPATIPLIQKDIFEITQSELIGFDEVIFLGGLSNDPMAEFAPQANFIYNTALPAYLGFMAREAGVKRLVYASSCSVYGYTSNKTFTETDPAVCNYPYGASKLQGEQALISLQTESFSVICLRQGTICGFSPRMRLDLAINTMFKNAMSLNHITLSNHKIWRPILGLKDLCQAYRKAVECDWKISGIFNIASFNTTVGELARAVADTIAAKIHTEIRITDKNIPDFRNYKVSWQKANQLLGYEPSQTDHDIIEELYSNFEVFKEVNDTRFYNIEVFKSMQLKPYEIK